MVKISQELYEAHRELAATNAAFLEFVTRTPGGLDRFDFDAYHPGNWFMEYIRFQTWPTFINRQTKAGFAKAAINVYDLIASIPERIFAYDHRKIAEYYGLPLNLVRLMFRGADNKFIRGLLTRGDYFLAPSGDLKCIEFNVQGNVGGGWQLEAVTQAYFDNPVIAGFLKEKNLDVTTTGFFTSSCEYAIDSALDHFSPGSGDEINMAVVFRKFSGAGVEPLAARLNKRYRDILRRKDSRLKGTFVIKDFFHLKVVDNRVTANVDGRDKPIHILVEKCNGMVPMEVLGAMQAGNVLLYNGPISQVMSNKLNLALLSENENSDIFSGEERETIKNHISWTRKVIPGNTTYEGEKIKLEDFILAKREQLVLKPGEGIAGVDVYLGCMTPPDQWKRQVDRALEEKKWVVQEYVPYTPYLYQEGQSGCTTHRAVWGIFVFGPRDGGGFIRVMPEKVGGGVINSYQGAQLGVIFEVDE